MVFWSIIMPELIYINLFLSINPIIIDDLLRNIVIYLRDLKICRLKIPSANTEISQIRWFRYAMRQKRRMTLTSQERRDIRELFVTQVGAE